jgi:oligoendopeptidase F
MNTEWDLPTYFYKSHKDQELERDVETFKQNVETLCQYKGRVRTLDENGFLEFLDYLSIFNASSERVEFYLALLSSLDTQDQDVQKTIQRLMKINVQLAEKLTFIDEEYKAMGYARIMELSRDPRFEEYRNYLVGQADVLKYLLSEREEQLLIKSDSASGENIYEELTSAFEFDLYGEKITDEEVRSKRESVDRQERLDACRSLAAVYGRKENQIVLGNLYVLVCKGNIFSKEVRGYKTVMEARNISEEVSNEVVDTLIKTVSDAYPLFHEFLRKKAEIMGLTDFAFHDVLAPIGQTSREFSFEEGWKLFLDTIKHVDPKLHGYSETMLEQARISVFPKKGKTSGAYANYAPHTPEFMLLNWTNTISDVSTLAHEMGHCFHGWLSKQQNPLVYETPLTLAETASIFCETIMFDRLIRSDMTEQEKQAAIIQRLDDIFGTIFRQIMYIRFERRCHESFDRNEPLTYDDFNRIWLEEVKALYGPDVHVDPELAQYGWSTIPHIFHTPFYCYTYAFGNIISLNLVQQYQQASNKDEFLQKYHSFLGAGGSERPEDLLGRVFNMKMDESFYSTALDSIRGLMLMLKVPETA